ATRPHTPAARPAAQPHQIPFRAIRQPAEHRRAARQIVPAEPTGRTRDPRRDLAPTEPRAIVEERQRRRPLPRLAGERLRDGFDQRRSAFFMASKKSLYGSAMKA